MSFFKEFKDDLSQAVNELLPNEEAEQEELVQEDTEQQQMVNTLDTEEIADMKIADNDKMMEVLDGFMQEDERTEEIIGQEEETEDSTENIENDYVEEFEGEEDENMDENVDLELLDALNADGLDTEEDIENTDKSNVKLKAMSVASDEDVTVITKGTTINGSISSDGSLEMMGTISGDVECLGKLAITGKITGNSSASEIYVNTERLEGNINSEGSVKVGLGTVIIGDVVATSGVIAGAIKGEIDINGPIVIDSTAIIKGNIKAKSVQINNGAVLEGFCSLTYAAVDVDNIFE